MIDRFLTWLLGPRCPLCNDRVYEARDGVRHRIKECRGRARC